MINSVNLKQKLTAGLVTLALTGAIALPAMAADNMVISPNPTANNSICQISLDGQKIDGNLQIMVPLRATAEALGYNINYNSNDNISVVGSDTYIKLAVGQNAYTFVDDIKRADSEAIKCTSATPVQLDAAPYINNNTVYVPLSLFAKIDSLNISANDSTINIDTNQNNQISNPITEHNTLSDLNKAVNFDVCAPSVTQYQITRYADIRQEIAEIDYTDQKGNEITFRSAKISDEEQDISGDYNQYKNEYGMAVGNVVVSCRGNNNINTAVWTANGFSYSLSSLDTGLTEETVKEFAKNIIK